MTSTRAPGAAARRRGTTRERLLVEGARLFAERGFHGVSVEDLGAAVGTSGPAVYKHFPSKDALLAAMLVGISEELLEGGRAQVAAAATADEALADLVAWQVRFALSRPELIRVHDRDLANLSAAEAHRVRRLQRAYVEVWVEVLRRLDAALPETVARLRVHAALGLINSTPHSARAQVPLAREQLTGMALAALRAGRGGR